MTKLYNTNEFFTKSKIRTPRKKYDDENDFYEKRGRKLNKRKRHTTKRHREYDYL